VRWQEKLADEMELAQQMYADRSTYRRHLMSWLQTRVWGVYYTQTFRRRVSEAGAAALWLSYLADTLSHSGVMVGLWAVERHASLRSHHVHALLQMKSQWQQMIYSTLSTRSAIASTRLRERSRDTQQEWTNWFRERKECAWKRLGSARMYPIDSSSAAAVWYVMKYVLKGVMSNATTTTYPDRRISSTHPHLSEPIAITSETRKPTTHRDDENLWGIWHYMDARDTVTLREREQTEGRSHA
jgi:hypothetical protein